MPMTDEQREALRGLGQGQVPAVVESLLEAERRNLYREVLQCLRTAQERGYGLEYVEVWLELKEPDLWR